MEVSMLGTSPRSADQETLNLPIVSVFKLLDEGSVVTARYRRAEKYPQDMNLFKSR